LLKVYLWYVQLNYQEIDFDWYVNFSNSNLLKSATRDYQQLQRRWSKSSALWDLGFYFESVSLRKELMLEISEGESGKEDSIYPHFMEAAWIERIGHIGLLGIHFRAQELGIVPLFDRTILKPKVIANPRVLNQIIGKTSFSISREINETWGALSQFWPYCEKVNLIKARLGYLDIYELCELVFANDDLRFFSLDLTDSNTLNRTVGFWPKLKYMNSNQFVTFHIRSESTAGDIRGANINNYVDAMRLVSESGFGVVAILDEGNVWWLDRELDFEVLKLHPREDAELHLVALANCCFLVGTCSGPSTISWVFGRPVLMTNTTAIGRNMLQTTRNSRYLPKRIYRGGHELSFSEILQSPLAYCEGRPSEFKKSNVSQMQFKK
jgi:putative glycosyltransferase (TIGR04372 family)